MADATFTLEARGADRVVNDIKKVNNATKKLNKTNVRGGMAVLEFSRGMEDFAMAGMRGAMNNVPGVLQSLGVGMGLTGVVTVAMVAVWKLTEAFEAYKNKMWEVAQAWAAVPIEGMNFDNLSKSFNKGAVENAKGMAKAMTAMASASSLVEHERGLAGKIDAKKRELEWAKELYELTKLGQTAEEIKLAKSWHATEAEEATASAAWDTVKARRESIKQLEAIRTGQQENLLGRPRIDAVNKIDKAYKEAVNRHNKAYLNRPGMSEKFKGANMFAVGVAEKLKELMIKDSFDSEGDYKTAVKKNEFAKENLKIVDEQLNKQQLLLTKEMASAKTAEEIAIMKQKQVDFDLERAGFESTQSKAKKDAEAAMKAKMAERVSVDQMLSSQAKAGLAGNEVRAAMDVLNIAKQSLDTLRRIARNTQGKYIPYA